MSAMPVLYVEDDDNDAFFLKKAFESIAVPNPLHVVYDGQEALDYLEGKGPFSDRRQHPLPGVVLLDLNLPKRPGLEILKWVREQPEFFTMPVIVLSASNQEVDVHRAYALGANAYLVKPTDVEKLADMMRTFRAFWLEQNTSPPECEKLKDSQLASLSMPGRVTDQSRSTLRS